MTHNERYQIDTFPLGPERAWLAMPPAITCVRQVPPTRSKPADHGEWLEGPPRSPLSVKAKCGKALIDTILAGSDGGVTMHGFEAVDPRTAGRPHSPLPLSPTPPRTGSDARARVSRIDVSVAR